MTKPLDKILLHYDPAFAKATADHLRALWIQLEPKSMDAIKVDLRDQQETLGIPVPVLRSIGKEISRAARKAPDDFVPLVQLLWKDYGREGRGVAVVPLGAMALANPTKIVPLLKKLCRTCITWEDADRLAMDALEPIVRKNPEEWLGAVEPWLEDDNKWVRRAGVTVLGRLPLKRPEYAERCLALIARVIPDPEVDVKKAASFAIRLVAKGAVRPVHDFLARKVPAKDPAATWVLCDSVRSMAKAQLPQFLDLLPKYEAWGTDPSLSASQRRSVESAIKTLRQAQG